MSQTYSKSSRRRESSSIDPVQEDSSCLICYASYIDFDAKLVDWAISKPFETILNGLKVHNWRTPLYYGINMDLAGFNPDFVAKNEG